MRWPFGPPHLTLKPSKKTKQKKQKTRTKTKTNKKNKNTKTKEKTKNKSKTRTNTKNTIQQQNKNKANKTETKATQKTKTNTRNTKTPKPSKPKINKNKPPHKSPKKLGKKQAFLTLLELCQTHQRQTTITLKLQKKTNPKKQHFAMFKNNPLFFIIFVFFQHTIFALKSCALLKTL